MKALPAITSKQQEILRLIYQYRFINRVQIQAFLGHKDYRRVNAWLADLRDKQYVQWIYSTDFSEKTKPAVYHISLNGIRYLKSPGLYPLSELRKRYKENKRSSGFVAHSVLVADVCLDLRAKSDESVRYTWQAQADFASSASEYHFLSQHAVIQPDLCFTKQENETTNAYLLEVFDATLPRYMVSNTLKKYGAFLKDRDWQRDTKTKAPPTILFVCPATTDLIYAKRRTRKLLETIYDKSGIRIKFAILEELKQSGVTEEIWEEA